MTGTIPVPASCMSRAGDKVEFVGQQPTGLFVMIPLTFMGAFPNRNKRKTPQSFRSQRFNVLVQVRDHATALRNCDPGACAKPARPNWHFS